MYSAAKTLSNDDLYMRYDDVYDELRRYRDDFRGKSVYCNCDDPSRSAFWRYFTLNFEAIGLRSVTATFLTTRKKSYSYTAVADCDSYPERYVLIRSRISGDGDFRSAACEAMLRDADVVVTSPPPSLLRAHLDMLLEYNKKFLVAGNKGALADRGVFPLIRDGIIRADHRDISPCFWLAAPNDDAYERPIGEDPRRRISACWITNLDVRRNPLSLSYNMAGIAYGAY